MSYNVLIVDDSAVARAFVVKTLMIAQLPLGVIYQATNGRDALTILKSKWVDLVLVDINMPEMNGIELVAAMREDAVLKTTPVIVVSSLGPGLHREHTLPLGISAFVQKPYTPERLRSVTFEALEVIHAE